MHLLNTTILKYLKLGTLFAEGKTIKTQITINLYLFLLARNHHPTPQEKQFSKCYDLKQNRMLLIKIVDKQ